MYRITIYEYENKSVDEFGDEDERIKTFSVSWISSQLYEKPFWEQR